MAYNIAIASGKGGTGKTTFAVNLYNWLNFRNITKVTLVDCDVEEPNDIIFFPNPVEIFKNEIYQSLPKINVENCIFCKKCVEYCEFNAISIVQAVSYVNVDSNLCHSCGACFVACNSNAIEDTKISIGQVSKYGVGRGNGVVEGKLKVGSSMQTMLIKDLLKSVSDENDICIYDAPPGTSCSVVETISQADYVILVTEPTPFGVHDLKLMVELCEKMKLNFGIVVNKAGIGNNEVYELINSHKIELLGNIPFDIDFIKSYSKGEFENNISPIIENAFINITDNIIDKYKQKNLVSVL